MALNAKEAKSCCVRIEAQTKRTTKIVWYLIKYLISTECEKESDNIRIHT